MIEVRNLSRNFAEIRAVDKASFTLQDAKVTGFLGPNGAGKTTTLRMLVGFLQPNEGEILLDGQSIFENPLAASARIGYLPEHNPLYDEMIVVEALQYLAELRGMSKEQYRQRKAFVLQSCGLSEVQYQKIGTLSKGYRQRVGLAQAILHDPDVLILDEPTSGLDPNQIIEIRQLIRNLGEHKTVILSSHILQEVQATCDHLLIINKGKIIVDDSIDNLDKYLTEYQIQHLELEGDNVDLSEFVDYYPEVEVLEESFADGHYRLKLKAPADIDIKHDLARFVAENSWLITNLYTERKSLEEIFHRLTQETEDILAQQQASEADMIMDIDQQLQEELQEADMPEKAESTDEEESK